MDETTLTAWLGVARAQALLLAGRPDEARTLAREALDATADDGLAAVRSPAAIVLAATGDLEPARRAASTEREVAERFGAPRWIANADTALGLINGDLAQLERAAAVLERSPFRLDLAAALIEHGAALRRAGERRAAREPLRRALELAHHHGAWLLSERASQELAASGARPRRIDVSGRDALTPAELRTARLAADGHSNREIAQLLWISPKTVETHLGRIYMKLGIGSRRELAHALDARPVPV
jgi:DNA-binding CsgD family transcriptional regulator